MNDAQNPTELLPCPFCGFSETNAGEDKEDLSLRWDDDAGFFVLCPNCDGEGPTSIFAEISVEKWNTRTPQWQPIETAPKCGRSFLACDIKSQDSQEVTGYDEFAAARSNMWWLVGDDTWHKDVFTHWKELDAQPTPPTQREGS